MALTRLSDVIVPTVFSAYMAKDTMITADIFQSGILVPDANMASLLVGGGLTFPMPAFGDLSDATGSQIASDDPTVSIGLDKVGTFQSSFIRQVRTKAWGEAELAAELAGAEPMQRIQSRVTSWWNRDFNRITIATLNGIIASNITNNAGDMVYSAGVGVGGAAPTAGLSAVAILNAKQTMGDKAELLSTIMMHSVVFTGLQIANLITYIPNSQGVVNIPTYLGYRVLVSDTCPAVYSALNFTYTSYLCAPGVLDWGESPVDVPVETFRRPDQGNGLGVEELYTRRQFALHPYGFHWTDTTRAGNFPTDIELATTANWVRRYPERKQIPFVAIKSLNG